jgi:hypothetical protein
MSSFADNVANKFNEVENKVSQDLNNPDINSENFLFFIKPNEIDEDGVCGLDQKLTVRIISVIALFSAGCAFISSLGKDNIFSLLWDLFISVFFLIVAFYTFYSTINLKDTYANIGYVVYSILWLINCLGIVCETIYYLFKFFYPFSDNFFRPRILAYIFCEWLGLILFLYLLWIVFCFMINLKRGKIA